jgi:hypothetical protein
MKSSSAAEVGFPQSALSATDSTCTAHAPSPVSSLSAWSPHGQADLCIKDAQKITLHMQIDGAAICSWYARNAPPINRLPT